MKKSNYFWNIKPNYWNIFVSKIIINKNSVNGKAIRKKIKTIYFPADCTKLSRRPIKTFWKEFEIPENCRALSVVGRIRPVKGQRILVKVFNKLLSEFSDLILLIAYRDTSENEPEMIALREDINRQNLKDNVRLIPERQDILQIMEYTI